ncbi:MAG: hypothetical protein WEA59_10125 [Ferruginibacter sp.]
MKASLAMLNLILNIVFFSASAQLPGYIVTHSGDTLNGNIVYKHNQFFVHNVFGKQDTIPSKK